MAFDLSSAAARTGFTSMAPKRSGGSSNPGFDSARTASLTCRSSRAEPWAVGPWKPARTSVLSAPVNFSRLPRSHLISC